MNTLTIKECTDTQVKPPAVSFLQTRFWAEFKKLHGWNYRQYEVCTGSEHSFLLTVLLRPLKPFGMVAYIPMGPSVLTDRNASLSKIAENRAALLTELAGKLIPLLPACVFLIRFDPPWECAVTNGQAQNSFAQNFPIMPRTAGSAVRYRLLKADTDIQPPDTVQLDLRLPLDTLLNECKPKWRYNIRLAEKKGVTVRCFSGAQAETGIPLFYRLYRETAVRDGIAIHAENYYRSLCRLAAGSEYNTEHMLISVYIAFFEEKPLAAIITLFSPYEAVYLYGASSNEHRNLMPAYLLQWTAIKDAQNYGSTLYDFYGIPPADDPAHPMYGLYRFKTGFGGTIVHRVGTVDIPVRLLHYCFYSRAERLRKFWFKTIKKKLHSFLRKSKNLFSRN